jgi:hypothetical protein
MRKAAKTSGRSSAAANRDLAPASSAGTREFWSTTVIA